MLVGTTSIENSELISGLLEKAKLPHQVLNAKQHATEAEIVAQAGRPGVITIATNMAGRGTDIVLGGNVENQIKIIDADPTLSPTTRRRARSRQLHDEWQGLHEQVKAQGGLRIIATERHESRRIDNQLRGRSGRQGDPGSSRFYLSLDDSLMRIFAGDRVRAIMERLKMPDGEAIEAGIVTRSIESAQRKVEARNFDMRKQLLEYDDVTNDQRKVIYQQRNEILEARASTAQIAQPAPEHDDRRRAHLRAGRERRGAVGPGRAREGAARRMAARGAAEGRGREAATSITDEDIVEQGRRPRPTRSSTPRSSASALEQFTPFMRMILLQSIDSHWREHLAALDYLRQGIHLRGYAQKNPKQEYKREAFELFSQLLDVVKMDVTRVLMTVRIQSQEEAARAAQAIEAQAESFSNVTYTHPERGRQRLDRGRDRSARRRCRGCGRAGDGAQGRPQRPVPCGSGKKYKQCHGKLA